MGEKGVDPIFDRPLRAGSRLSFWLVSSSLNVRYREKLTLRFFLVFVVRRALQYATFARIGQMGPIGFCPLRLLCRYKLGHGPNHN
jgi:hypothetical protein